jgi:hypothetical protein
MVYELKLPNDWRIHNVLDVSLLKKIVFDPNKLLQDLPQATVEKEIVVKLERI